MEYKQLLDDHRKGLIDKLKVDDYLLSRLVDSDVLTDYYYYEISGASGNTAKVDLLIVFLKKRGPKRWKQFIAAVYEEDQLKVIEELFPFTSKLSKENERQFDSLNVKKHTKNTSEMEQYLQEKAYPVESADNIKLNLIVNIQGEVNFNVTQTLIEGLFEDMNIEVNSYLNDEKSVIIKKLEDDSKDNNMELVQCYFLMVFQFYGKTTHELNFIDNQRLSYMDFLKYFSNKSCPHLQGKPKIFIFSVNSDTYSDEELSTIDLSIKEFFDAGDAVDFLVCIVPVNVLKDEGFEYDQNKIDWFTYDFVTLMNEISNSKDLIFILEKILHPNRIKRKRILRHNLTKEFHFSMLY